MDKNNASPSQNNTFLWCICDNVLTFLAALLIEYPRLCNIYQQIYILIDVPAVLNLW